MSQAASVAVKPQPVKVKHPTLVSAFVFALFKLIFMSVTAWFVLVLWFVGKALLSGESTALAQAQSIVRANLQFIGGSSFSWNWILFSFFNTFHVFYLHFIQKLDVWSHQWLQTTLNLLLAVSEIDLSRLIIFLLSLPLFLLTILVFITDGLVKRDIRKFKGARETTFLFHRSKYLFGFCLFTPFFIYLSLPIFISPIIYLTAQSILLGIVVNITTTYFKKYL